MALYVVNIFSFCFLHIVDVSVLNICILRDFVVREFVVESDSYYFWGDIHRVYGVVSL